MQFLKRLIRLLTPVFKTKETKKLMVLILVSTVAMVLLGAGITYWRTYFIDSFQKHDKQQWINAMFIFTGLTLSNVILKGYNSFWSRKTEFHWRELIYNHLTKHYEDNRATIDCAVPEQRLLWDTIQISQLSINLLIGFVTSLIQFPIFLFILVSVAGFKVAMFAFVYSIAGSLLAKYLANPLVKLDYEQQNREGDLNRELITFVKQNGSVPSLEAVKLNWLELAYRNKLLGFFQSGFSQVSAILPFALLAPSYFTGFITMGVLWTTADAMGKLLESISYFVDKRDVIAQTEAVLKRLEELE